jgi:hypothetical protein
VLLCPSARVQVTAVGTAVRLEDEEEVEHLMFSRHPQMRLWSHMAHKWQFYELDIKHVEILDFFGGFHHVSREDYFAAKPLPPLRRSAQRRDQLTAA